jgi:N-acetylglutamate synthase-like GNAT family acetyltransferase
LTVDDAALREMAANRGYKLVKSRRRKPGTGDYGRYGLTDAATGAECLGFGQDGLTATAEEIGAYLRGGAAKDWKTSLEETGSAEKPPTRPKEPEEPRAPSKPRRERAPERKAKPEPTPKPEPAPEPEPQPAPPPLTVREARPNDAAAIAALVGTLAVETSETDIARTLQRLRKAGEPPLVADQDGVVGCLAWHAVPMLHRQKPIARISLLVVSAEARRRGIGRALVEAALERFAAAGCDRVEAVAEIGLGPAQDFFRRSGFDRSFYRFTRDVEA